MFSLGFQGSRARDHCDPRFHSASLGPGGLTQLPGCYRGHGAVASGLQPADGTAMVEVADGRWLWSLPLIFPTKNRLLPNKSQQKAWYSGERFGATLGFIDPQSHQMAREREREFGNMWVNLID